MNFRGNFIIVFYKAGWVIIYNDHLETTLHSKIGRNIPSIKVNIKIRAMMNGGSPQKASGEKPK